MKALPCLLVSGLIAVAACDSRSGDDPLVPAQTGPGAGNSGDSGAFDPGEPTPPIPPGISGGTVGGVGVPVGLLGGTGFLGGIGGTAVGPSGRPVRLEQLRTAATPPPPISGGTLVVSSDGTQVVAADPDRDQVYVIDPIALKVQKVSLARGTEPGRVALDGLGGAHVALRGTGKLLRIDLASAAASTETAICAHPRGVAFDAKNSAVVATCMDGQVVSLDAASHQEKARQTLPTDLRDVVVNAAGARWIARYRSAELLTMAGDTVKSTTQPTQGFADDGIRGIIADDILPGDGGVSFVDAGSTMLSGPSTLSPTLAWRVLPSQRGGVWMLHQRSRDGEIVAGQGGYGSGCQTITTGGATEFDADGKPSRTMPIQLQGLSVDAALSPDETWLAVASPGGFARSQTTLQLYTTSGAQPTPTQGECASPALTDSNESQVVAVAFDGAGLLYTLSREPAELAIYELQGTQASPFNLPGSLALMRRATIALDARSMRDTGHDLFHADVGQGLACASCHGEVLDDAHVWNFEKIGPRRTQNMRGGFLATAPFHWDGDQMSMSHLVDDVMTGRMGGFKVELSFATALGQWLQQQPALTVPVSDSGAASRGKDLFNARETACSTCHSGANFTSNENKDVGTGGSFQVPGLLGLSLRAPYMHNGCAKTLLDRFDPACGGGDAHGHTSQLSDAQRLDLIAYLRSL